MRKAAMGLATGVLLVTTSLAAGPNYQRLTVEQQGATDAALQPFAIEIGSPPASTREVVFVEEQIFDAVVAETRSQEVAGGQFRVTLQAGQAIARHYDLNRVGLARMMLPVTTMFRTEGIATPPFVLALAIVPTH